MPREGTKTVPGIIYTIFLNIEIRYAPGGDENDVMITKAIRLTIEIRYTPGGDENSSSYLNHIISILLRLDMPREGTKT